MLPTRLLYGPALLVLWQAAPVSLQRDTTTGKLYFGFGAEAGRVEARQLNCAGDVVSAMQVPYGSAGGSVEYWPNARWRFSGGAGGLAVNHLPAHAFGTMMVAFEGRHVGVGAGVGYLSYPEIPLPKTPLDSDPSPHADGTSLAVPALYLRLGSRDDMHIQAELLPPSETPSASGYVRLGLGGPVGSSHVTFLTGATAGPYANGKYQFRWFGDVTAPISNRVDLGVRVMAGPGYASETTGLGLVARYRFDTH